MSTSNHYRFLNLTIRIYGMNLTLTCDQWEQMLDDMKPGNYNANRIKEVIERFKECLIKADTVEPLFVTRIDGKWYVVNRKDEVVAGPFNSWGEAHLAPVPTK